MPSVRRLSPLVAALVAAGVAAAGCGGSSGPHRPDPSAATLVTAAVDGLSAQRAAHVVADVTAPTLRAHVDARYQGQNSEVVIDRVGQGSERVRVVDGTDYVQADASFWAANLPTVPAGLATRWLKLPGHDAQTGPVDFTHLSWAGKSINDAGLAHGTVVSDRIGDRPVWRVSAPGARLWVDTRPPRLPVRFVAGAGGTTISADFLGFGPVAPITAPPDAIDLAQFAGVSHLPIPTAAPTG